MSRLEAFVVGFAVGALATVGAFFSWILWEGF